MELATAGEVDGIVTAPLNKATLNMAGYHFPGHTELLAHLTGTKGTVLMLAHGGFRVTHVTTHVALERVPSLMTPERVRRVLDLTLAALRRLGIERPRIAVAALNPHAGEGGIFGRQDIEVTTPLVAEFRANGEAVEGPVPGDTVFVNLRAGRYDAVVAMYHDQGHIPVKLLGFNVDPRPAPGRPSRASTSPSASPSSAPRSTTAPPSTSPARASPTPPAWSRRSTTRSSWRGRGPRASAEAVSAAPPRAAGRRGRLNHG